MDSNYRLGASFNEQESDLDSAIIVSPTLFLSPTLPLPLCFSLFLSTKIVHLIFMARKRNILSQPIFDRISKRGSIFSLPLPSFSFSPLFFLNFRCTSFHSHFEGESWISLLSPSLSFFFSPFLTLFSRQRVVMNLRIMAET